MLKAVTFIIPALNGARTIGRCLDSINGLSYPQELIEIIVVDNGSSDNTSAIANKYKNVKVLLEPRRGRSYARNTGWRASKHEYIAFIDCDVVLEKQWLRYMIKQFQSPHVACSQGKIIPVPMSSKPTLFERYRFFNKNGNTQFTMIETAVPHQMFPVINTASSLYRKSVLEKLTGFDTNLERAEDVDLSIRVSRAGYIVSYNDMALSYVYWDQGGFISYLKREISHAYYLIILKRKFFSHRDSLLSNLRTFNSTLPTVWQREGELSLKLIRFFFKFVFSSVYILYDFFLKNTPTSPSLQGKSIFSISLKENPRHKILRKVVARHRKLRDPLAVIGFSAHPDTRIVISNKRIILLNTLIQRTFQFRDEEFYFLRSLILDDDYFFIMAGKDAFEANATTLIPQLLSSLFLIEELDSAKLCLNPFIVFKRLVNEDNESEGFCFNGGRAFRGVEETITNRTQPYFVPIVDYLEKQLTKEDWFSDITTDLRPEMLSWLCDQEIITDRDFFKTILHKSFDLEAFFTERSEFKNNKIPNLNGDFQVSPLLLAQLKGEKHKFEFFKSHLKQLNNLMSLSDSVYWVEPWSFHHPMPLYLTDNLKRKLLHFDRKAWSESELLDLLDAGVLVSSELQEITININHLAGQFKTTQAFYAPQVTSAYLTWSMGKYLYHYFKTNLVKMGDTQCADRRAVYDSPLCLHVQDGMAKLINKVLPFKVKSSFNYSVCYYQHADLYPHKDRVEAPYSMSYTLAAYDGDQRSHYRNTLGFENDDGKKTEIELADGDIALFNGAELTHYRHPIAENKSLYVIVMHFVREDFTGQIG